MMSYQSFLLFVLSATAAANSGTSNCKCIAPVALGGVTATGGMVDFTNSSDSAVSSVPATYGTYCKAWDTEAGQEYYAACTTDSESWCTDAWCYIDMCNCDRADMGSSSYFTVASTLKLGYSYETCTNGTSSASYLQTFCAGLSSCDSASCKSDGSSCIPASSTEMLKAVGCTGKDGCSCINPVEAGNVAAAAGMVAFTSGATSGVTQVPSQYGAGCSAWDTAEGMEYYSDCLTDNASWCTDPWCYIDLCDCDTSDLATASYFTQDKTVGFSYETCDGGATSTQDYLTTFCKGQTACADASVCKDVDGTCTPKTAEEIKGTFGCPTTSTTAAGGGGTGVNTASNGHRLRSAPVVVAAICVVTFVLAAWGQ